MDIDNSSASFSGNIPPEYDFIISGGGMAGLSLAYYLHQSSLRDNSVLIIDRESKDRNDHTWCFWEKEDSVFEEIIFRKWNGVWFHGSNHFSKWLNLGDYQYKMLRGIDFYEYVKKTIRTNPDFQLLKADILGMEEVDGQMQVKTSVGNFRSKHMVFDSTYRSAYDNPSYNNMLQHFMGWTIETEKPVFKPEEPTLFDFRTDQKNECRFMYVLPHSAQKALIEFTVFSDNILKETDYQHYLKSYIQNILKSEAPETALNTYKITETEFGIIPMSDEPHQINPVPGILRIGTAGGFVKSSTGYSFQRTQRKLKKLVEMLEQSEGNFQSIDWHKNLQRSGYIPTWNSYLDSILLRVMLKKKHPSDDIFTRLFSKNTPSVILKFLDEDTSFKEELSIMRTVPTLVFLRSAFIIALKKFFSGD
ncbi:lycopene beta-cyclase [Pseudarcicella hirudinis]|uniref:Lycopene beta-cyclase n=1 Tax=Pseudarcicella hirudinis TaxID=1079859 RepID=A0A1I5S0K6_9BACT|nr:lycopene cyclase family protein [Pseudarcicella hirudinis]SFP64315.1 lycopene beta-cyclase [Pseudarcicella hirudinis]